MNKGIVPYSYLENFYHTIISICIVSFLFCLLKYRAYILIVKLSLKIHKRLLSTLVAFIFCLAHHPHPF